MRIGSSGQSKPSMMLRLVQRALTLVGGTIHVDVVDGEDCYRFICTNQQTLRRATTLLIKEAGTIRWLREQAKPGRVFLDIGANVGIYSLFAAHQLGEQGHTYAVEPHLRNAVALLDNVHANQLQQRISLLCMALSRRPAVTEFHYREWGTGSSHSQLQADDPIALDRAPIASELKAATSVDELIASSVIRPPDFIKIDVDGIELPILEGASALLRGNNCPRSIQVECESGNLEQIDEFMAKHDYELDERHATMAGAKRIARGALIEELPHNAIYRSRSRD